MVATRRKELPATVKHQVLMEAGYKCGNPACRNVITLHIHHMVSVTDGGGDDPSNLLALCPYCHAMHHAGEIPNEAIRHWKGMLLALNHAFGRGDQDLLLFLYRGNVGAAKYSSDGLLRFAGLIAAGLVEVTTYQEQGAPGGAMVVSHRVRLTQTGTLLIEAWVRGDEEAFRSLVS